MLRHRLGPLAGGDLPLQLRHRDDLHPALHVPPHLQRPIGVQQLEARKDQDAQCARLFVFPRAFFAGLRGVGGMQLGRVDECQRGKQEDNSSDEGGNGPEMVVEHRG